MFSIYLQYLVTSLIGIYMLSSELGDFLCFESIIDWDVVITLTPIRIIRFINLLIFIGHYSNP